MILEKKMPSKESLAAKPGEFINFLKLKYPVMKNSKKIVEYMFIESGTLC